MLKKELLVTCRCRALLQTRGPYLRLFPLLTSQRVRSTSQGAVRSACQFVKAVLSCD